jgi:hypothetical protein
MIKVILGMLGNIMGGWAVKLILNPKFLEWVIRWCARRLVEHTKTPNDNIWLDRMEAMLELPKLEEEASLGKGEGNGK